MSVSRAAWLAERRTYLGSTDIAAIAGMHKYKSPLSVWLEKTGREIDQPMSIAAKRGLALEPLVADIYSQVEGVELEECGVVRHPDFPFIACNPDRLVVGKPKGVEIKTFNIHVRHEWGEDGTDHVPIAYWAQAQVNMQLVSLLKGEPYAWDVIGFDDAYEEWHIHPIPRRDDVWGLMVEKACAFWRDYVQADKAPDATAHECDTEWLKQAFPKYVPGEVVLSTPELDALATEYVEANRTIAPLTKRKEHAANRLRQFAENAEAVETIVGRFTFRTDDDKTETDWEKVVGAVKAYAPMVVHDPDAIRLLDAEFVRAVNQFTTTKPGARRIQAPRKSNVE